MGFFIFMGVNDGVERGREGFRGRRPRWNAVVHARRAEGSHSTMVCGTYLPHNRVPLKNPFSARNKL